MYVDDIKLAVKKHNIDPMWKVRIGGVVPRVENLVTS